MKSEVKKLISSYERFYHVTSSSNIDSILSTGLIPNKYEDMDYDENCPEIRAQICLTVKSGLNAIIKSFEDTNPSDEFAVFEISAEFVSTLDFGLDWTFSGTFQISKLEEFESIKSSIENFGTLACFEMIPYNELSLRAFKVSENGITKKFKVLNGEEVNIYLDEIGLEIKVTNSQNQLIGKVNFKEIEYDNKTEYKITNMYMDLLDIKYTRKGLGQATLELFKEYYGDSIIVNEHDGITSDDGGHLTGMGPIFVEKMKREGILK